MKQKLLTIIISLAIAIQASAQERTVENRPYTDLRPFHFGVLVGTHFQDIEFQNAGPVTYLDADGIEQQGCVTVDQDRWDPGFTVGVLGEFRLNTHFQLRIAPAMFAAQRFNNHRPYIMAGINPMMNLNSKNEDYIKLKKTDLFLELGLGCDFYLPYFKLRPELKFMYGITDTYDKNHIKNIKDKSSLPYTLSAKSAHSKMIALTFYFE